jgi:hypothetical protein
MRDGQTDIRTDAVDVREWHCGVIYFVLKLVGLTPQVHRKTSQNIEFPLWKSPKKAHAQKGIQMQSGNKNKIYKKSDSLEKRRCFAVYAVNFTE